MNKIKLMSVALLATVATLAQSQVNVKTEAGDLKITFKGRTHFDAGIYGGDAGKNSHDHLTNVVRMNDTRFGFIASFDEKYTVKCEYRFTGTNTGFTDLWMGYKLNDNSNIQLGNYWMPFGYKVLGPAYRFIQNSSIDETVNVESRKIGLSYNYNSDLLKFTAGIFSDGNVNSISNNQGYHIGAKAIVRPILEEGRVLHLGVAPLFTHTPRTVNFATQSLTQGRRIGLIGASFANDEQYNIFRGEAEAIFISGKLYLEGRYQHAQINTPDEENYAIGGFAIQGGFLLIGDKQNYNKANGYATNLSGKNLEVTARFGHVAHNNNDDMRKISENDITIGLNYGFNKYLMAKLNWSHAQCHLDDMNDNNILEKANYSAVEARLQFVF